MFIPQKPNRALLALAMGLILSVFPILSCGDDGADPDASFDDNIDEETPLTDVLTGTLSGIGSDCLGGGYKKGDGCISTPGQFIIGGNCTGSFCTAATGLLGGRSFGQDSAAGAASVDTGIRGIGGSCIGDRCQAGGGAASAIMGGYCVNLNTGSGKGCLGAGDDAFVIGGDCYGSGCTAGKGKYIGGDCYPKGGCTPGDPNGPTPGKEMEKDGVLNKLCCPFCEGSLPASYWLGDRSLNNIDDFCKKVDKNYRATCAGMNYICSAQALGTRSLQARLAANSASKDVTNCDDSGAGSLRAAMDYLNANGGGTINIVTSCVDQSPLKLASNLPDITQDMEILVQYAPDPKTPYGFTIDGGGKFRSGFYIDGTNVTIYGITMKGGIGAVVNEDGNLVVDKCVFLNNTGDSAVRIIDDPLDPNAPSRTTIWSSVFYGNQSSTQGGAMNFFGTGTGTVLIRDSQFVENRALSGTERGGAVYFNGKLASAGKPIISSLVVEGSYFVTNSVIPKVDTKGKKEKTWGGAVYIEAAGLTTVIDSVFMGNSDESTTGRAIFNNQYLDKITAFTIGTSAFDYNNGKGPPDVISGWPSNIKTCACPSDPNRCILQPTL